jgi:hypothetical protein
MKKIATSQRKAATNNQPNFNKISAKPIDDEIIKRLKPVWEKLTEIRARLVLHLICKLENTTGDICHACKIGNLSDMVNKINPTLEKHGLVIINYPPANPLLNSFGEPTTVHCWELVILDDGSPTTGGRLTNSVEEKNTGELLKQVA